MIPCQNSAKSCGDPHCVQHRGKNAIPLPPDDESIGLSPAPAPLTVNEFRREVLDKLHVFAAANVNPNGVHKAIVQQQCLDHLTDIYRLAASARSTSQPVCQQCDAFTATCFGFYEAGDDGPTFACDSCCGHGNEDGWCKPIAEFTAWLDGIWKELRAFRELGSPQPPTEERLIIEEMLQRIESGHKGSIGSIENTYMPQIGVEEIKRWRDRLAPTRSPESQEPT